MTRVAVIGAGGAVGEAVVHALIDRGMAVVASMRRDHHDAGERLRARGAVLARVDLARREEAIRALAGVDAVVFTPILSVSAPMAPLLAAAGVRDGVFLSSNHVAIDPGNATYAGLLRAEAAVRSAMPRAVIVRPTLIYGDPRLETMTRLVRWMRRVAIMPVPGRWRALQQPVFHEDVARVCAGLVGAQGGIFAIGGPETMTQIDLYRRVSRAAGGVRALAPMPKWALNLAARVVPLPLDAAQIARADLDKIAVPVDPLPAELAPRTAFDDGIARLLAELRREEAAWRGAQRSA